MSVCIARHEKGRGWPIMCGIWNQLIPRPKPKRGVVNSATDVDAVGFRCRVDPKDATFSRPRNAPHSRPPEKEFPEPYVTQLRPPTRRKRPSLSSRKRAQ